VRVASSCATQLSNAWASKQASEEGGGRGGKIEREEGEREEGEREEGERERRERERGGRERERGEKMRQAS